MIVCYLLDNTSAHSEKQYKGKMFYFLRDTIKDKLAIEDQLLMSL